MGKNVADMSAKELAEYIKSLEAQMFQAAEELEYERAAQLRDQISELREVLLEVG